VRRDGGRWRFEPPRHLRPTDARRLLDRQEACRDPVTGLLFFGPDVQGIDAAALCRAYHRQAAPLPAGAADPAAYPVYLPSGALVHTVTGAAAQRLLAKGLAVWRNPRRPALGLVARPDALAALAAATAPRPGLPGRRRLEPPERTLARLARRLPADRALELAARAARRRFATAPTRMEGAFWFACQAVFTRYGDPAPDPARLARWLAAVRAGQDPDTAWHHPPQGA
jgi:hypothetical protein